jgi:hypothetical protein
MWGQTNNIKLVFNYSFSTNHAVLRSNNKDWLARNHYNVSEWSDMSIYGLFYLATTGKIQLSVLI